MVNKIRLNLIIFMHLNIIMSLTLDFGRVYC